MMKKLMVAAFAVMAMVGGAQAAKTYGLQVDAYVQPYAEKAPESSKYGFYTLYAMKQADVQAAMGRTTTVTYSDVATWLGENFVENRKAVTENGQAFSACGKNSTSTQYKFSDNTGGYDSHGSAKDAIGVYLYDDGTSVAYNVFSNGIDEDGEIATTYFVFDTDCDSSASGWQAASVPEPTSGLLLLLGMAGLALKRKRVVG